MFFSSLTELFHDSILFSQNGTPLQDIQYTLFYPSDSDIDIRSAAVIGDCNLIDKDERIRVPNLILSGDETDIYRFSYLSATANYLLLHCTGRLRSREDIGNAILTACRRSDQIISLLQSKTNNHSFSNMLTAAAQYLSLPLFLTNASGHMIDCARIPYTTSWSNYIDSIPSLNNRNEYRALPARVLRSKAPVFCEADPHLSVFACPVMRQNVVSNLIIAVCADHSLRALERALLHETALFFTTVAPKLPLQVAPNDMLSYLLQLLLLHPSKKLSEDDEMLLARRGWYKTHRYCVYCIQFQNPSLSSAVLDDWQQLLSSHFPQAFVTENNNRLYVIYNLTTYTKLRRKEVMHKLLECLNMPFVRIGASSSCPNIEQLCSARLLSEMAIDIGTVLDPALRAYEYDRYGIYHLLMTSNADLDILIHPLVRLLIDHDRENRTEYTKTLSEYLNANLRPGVAAQNLCIHKNSLDYRIRRIHEISHPRLEEPERVMAFRLSFAVLTYQSHLTEFEALKEKYALLQK